VAPDLNLVVPPAGTASNRDPGELCRARLIISFSAMAEREVLRVDPEVMQGVSQALSGAAKDLHNRLIQLDSQVRDMLADWQGGAGGAYGQAWDLWHRVAGEVQLGLSILAKAVGVAGVDFEAQDSVSAQALRSVGDG
jgi:WXG100 family type VII secretion target